MARFREGAELLLVGQELTLRGRSRTGNQAQHSQVTWLSWRRILKLAHSLDSIAMLGDTMVTG